MESGSYSSNSKYELLANHFKPNPDYTFPKSSTGRSFQYQWLIQFPTVRRKEVFVFRVFFFASFGYHGSSPGVLVSHPLLHKHAEKGYHKEGVVRYEEFRKVMAHDDHQQPDIINRLNQNIADTIASNRKILSSIFKTIELCGRQNIAFCGHHDNATDIEGTCHSENHGNFRALLEIRVDAGDFILNEHLTTASNLLFRMKTLRFLVIISGKRS